MNEKVLVVDDDPSILRLAAKILQRKEYDVITATNGLQALQKARNESPDLIILDLMLPGLDGFEICDRLRHTPETFKVPILILSAKGSKSDKLTAANLGANAYLTKPIDSPEFLSYVEALLAGAPLPGS